MTTQAQILANRLNAQKSTGPRSPQGKAGVAQNALKHGLSAARDVIFTESQQEFDLHRAALLPDLDPQTPTESFLADRIISLSWRLKRADQIQNQTFDAMYEESTAPASLPGLPKFLTRATENQNPALTLGRIAIKDFSNTRVLDRLLMYERRIEHSLFKSMLELQRLRILRELQSSQPALEPETPALAHRPATTEWHHQAKLGDGSNATSEIRYQTCELRKTNPISPPPQTSATSATTKTYNQFQPPPKPRKQTQFKSSQRPDPDAHQGQITPSTTEPPASGIQHPAAGVTNLKCGI